jgi:predicted TIM-barrel fold metal-dependent hydrolase
MLADSHIHLFENGYQNSGKNTLETYLPLIHEFSISRALVIGYEGEPWALGNNAYIVNLKKSNSWISPVAFVKASDLSLENLESLVDQGFVGISLYISTHEDVGILRDIDDEIWQWLVDNNWIISVNSKGDLWLLWMEVLKRNPTLTLLISHIGLITIPTKPASEDEIAIILKTIASLMNFSNVYLKLSGFYALEPTDPVHAYRLLDPYIRYVVEKFSVDRLIWGSDFPLSLDKVSFGQTFENLNYIEPLKLKNILENNLQRLLR